MSFFQGPSIQKKMTILFFVYFGTHNNKIHTIYKQTSVFVLVFSHVVVLVLLPKQQQQKSVNLYTISVSYAWAMAFSFEFLQNVC
jgi:hypothetical protein